MHASRFVVGILGAALFAAVAGSHFRSVVRAQTLGTGTTSTTTQWVPTTAERTLWDDFYKTLAPDASSSSMPTWATKYNVTVASRTATGITLQYAKAVTGGTSSIVGTTTLQMPTGGVAEAAGCKDLCGTSHSTTSVRITPTARWEEKETCNFKSCTTDSRGNVSCQYTCTKTVKML